MQVALASQKISLKKTMLKVHYTWNGATLRFMFTVWWFVRKIKDKCILSQTHTTVLKEINGPVAAISLRGWWIWLVGATHRPKYRGFCPEKAIDGVGKNNYKGFWHLWRNRAQILHIYRDTFWSLRIKLDLKTICCTTSAPTSRSFSWQR